jgi:hypothetical protein
MINEFRLRRVLRTHPAGFVSKFLFIRVIRGFNFGSRVQAKSNPKLLCKNASKNGVSCN